MATEVVGATCDNCHRTFTSRNEAKTCDDCKENRERWKPFDPGLFARAFAYWLKRND